MCKNRSDYFLLIRQYGKKVIGSFDGYNKNGAAKETPHCL